MDTILLVECSECGALTEWDESLGGAPLCPRCWDARAGIDNEVAAYKRRYREDHKDEVAAYQRRYYEDHKDEVAAYQRRYYEDHKDEVAASINVHCEVKCEGGMRKSGTASKLTHRATGER